MKLQESVVAYLALDGWRAIRTDPVSDRARGKGFGEVGLFVRYEPTAGCMECPGVPGGPKHCPACASTACVMWIEFKRAGQKPRANQLARHQAERKRGALVMVVDDIDAFMAWYRKSGLCRRVAA